MSLLDGLIEHYRLDAAGLLVGAHAGKALTNTGSVTTAAGRIGEAASFDGSNYLTRTDAAFARTTGSLTVAAWFKPTAYSGTQSIVTHASISPLNFNYIFRLDGGTLTLYAGTTSLNSVGRAVPNDGNWHLGIGWVDRDAGTVNVQVDDGTVASASYTQGDGTSGPTLTLGAGYGGPAGERIAGLIDAVSIASRVWDAAERTAYYNAGAGFDYPFGAAAASRLLSLRRRLAAR